MYYDAKTKSHTSPSILRHRESRGYFEDIANRIRNIVHGAFFLYRAQTCCSPVWGAYLFVVRGMEKIEKEEKSRYHIVTRNKLKRQFQ